METVDKSRSFAYFVYPFLFDVPPLPAHAQASGEMGRRDVFCVFAEQIGASELDGKKMWADWPVPVNDMMPHVAAFLDPKNKTPTGRFWQLGNDVSQKLQTNKIEWRMLRGKTAAPIPFVLGGGFVAQLALFRHGVGFITVCARPSSDNLADWLAFLHDFRFMHHRGDVRVCAEKETFDPASKQKARTAFRPLDVPGAAADQSFSFLEVVYALLKASGVAHASVFTPGHTLPYASLFVRGADEAGKLLAIHRLRNFFSTEEGANPSQEDLRPDHPAHLPYAHDQWFLQTLNGGSFIAFEPEGARVSEFQKNVLPGHLQQVYFCAGLLALYQRFALARLSQRVATKALTGGDKEWKEIRDDLLDFTARGYFTQAMQFDHHHRYYRKWQEVFQIPQLYAEVRDEVRDMYERATLNLRQEEDAREKREEEREKRVEKRLSLLGLLFAVPALILGFLGVNIQGYTNGDGLSLAVLAGWVAGGFVLAALAYWILVIRDRAKTE